NQQPVTSGDPTFESITCPQPSPHGSALPKYRKSPNWRTSARGVWHVYATGFCKVYTMVYTIMRGESPWLRSKSESASSGSELQVSWSQTRRSLSLDAARPSVSMFQHGGNDASQPSFLSSRLPPISLLRHWQMSMKKSS